MKTQCTSQVLMIRPAHFAYNAQTAVNNAFQHASDESEQIHRNALHEFNGMTRLLRENGVEVLILDDTPVPHTPDSIFPNNWISFHSNGTIVLYPMFAPNRRLERKPMILERIRERYKVRNILNLTDQEKEGMFLEGTGSLVLDRKDHLAYACISERTHAELVEKFCHKMNYKAFVFHATDKHGQPIYHTNVMMSMGADFACVCLGSVRDARENQELRNKISQHKKEIIEIDEEQMSAFAGNMLQLQSASGQSLIVMSTRAYTSLRADQLGRLEAFGKIIHTPLDTIENNGGGSARCMIAEIFNPSLF